MQGAVNPFENNMFAFFADPVMFATAVTWLSGLLTEMITDALKDRRYDMRGWHTRLVAGGVAAVLAGAGGYFGLSYFTGLSGWEGAGTAAGMALGAWLFADVKHRAGQLDKTGMRKEVREATRKVADVAVDGVLEGLVAASRLVPPPYSLLVSEQTVRDLYAKHGAGVVQDLIDRQPKPDEVHNRVAEKAAQVKVVQP